MSFLGSVSRLGGTVARPHDLQLHRDPERARQEATQSGSAVTEAVVDRLVRLGFEVRVELRHADSDEHFFAQLTRAEAADLNLEVGDKVWVLPTRTLASETVAAEEEFPALVV